MVYNYIYIHNIITVFMGHGFHSYEKRQTLIQMSMVESKIPRRCLRGVAETVFASTKKNTSWQGGR